MTTTNKYSPFRITALATTIAVLALTFGCSSSGETPNAAVDTSGLSEQEIRGAGFQGAARGVSANLATFSTVMSNASVLEDLNSQLGSSRGLPGTPRALKVQGDNALTESGGVDELVATLEAMFEDSSVAQTDNVYTFDPDETKICADSSVTQTNVAQCETLLGNMTAEMTVNATANNEVTAATTDFLYSGSVLVTVDFAPGRGYYELNLSGLKTLLQSLNDAAPAEEKEAIPAVMSGVLRASYTTTGDYAASMTLSVPEAITIEADSANDPVNFNLSATDSLASLSANTNDNSMTLEVGLNAINLIATDKDENGNSFPIELALSALTGKAVVTDNGDTLTLTGIGINGLSYKVDQRNAATVNLADFGATLSGAGDRLQTTLNSDFDFDMTLENIHGALADYFESTAETQSLTVAVDAPANTQFTELATDITKITGGPLTISKEKAGEANVYVEVVDGACLDTSVDPAQTIVCPSDQ